MPKLKIEKKISLGPDEAYAKVKTFIETDETLRKLDSHYKCTFDEAAKSCKAVGNQFTAVLAVQSQGSDSVVTVDVEIPFALALIKGKIEEILRHKLDKYLV